MNRADESIVIEAIRAKVQAMVEEEAEAAAARVRERVRAVAAHIALELLEFYSIERFGPELRITVKTEL